MGRVVGIFTLTCLLLASSAFAQSDDITAVQKAVMGQIEMAERGEEYANLKISKCRTNNSAQFFLSTCKKSKKKKYREAQRLSLGVYDVAKQHFSSGTKEREKIDLSHRRAGIIERAVKLDIQGCLDPDKKISNESTCVGGRYRISIEEYIMRYRKRLAQIETDIAELDATPSDEWVAKPKVESLFSQGLKAENLSWAAEKKADLCKSDAADKLEYSACPADVQKEIIETNIGKSKIYEALIRQNGAETKSSRQYRTLNEKFDLENQSINIDLDGCLAGQAQTVDCTQRRNGLTPAAYIRNYKATRNKLTNIILDLY